MSYSIDGKLLERNNKQNNIKNNEIKEDFINIPFFQFTSATNAGLRSTSNLTVDKDANIKGNVNLDGNLVSTSNLTVDKNANIKGNINLDGNLIKDEMEINFDKYWIQSDDQKNIYYNGNVGIGTTDPKNKLEVRGDVFLNNFSNNSYDRWGAKLFFDKGFDNKDRGDLKIDLYNKSGHYGFGVKGSTTAYYSASMHRFLYGDATKTDVMMLKNGNVGIGTINPKTILDIHVNDIYKGLSLTRADVKMVLGTIGGGNNSASIQVFRHVTNSTPSSSSVPYNLILQPNGGNVGIGTKNPRGKLEVIGEGGMPIFIRSTAKNKNWNDGHQILSLRNDAITSKDGHGYGKPCLSMDWDIGNNAHWCFGQGGVTGVHGNTSTMGIGYQDKDENIAAAYGWVPKFFFTKGGNLGIGPSDPTSKLDVRLGQSTLTERKSSAMNVYKNFNGVDNGNYAARIYALDHKIKETGIRICEKGGSNLKSSSTKVLDVYSNGSSVMTVGGDGKLTVKGGTGNVILGDNRVDLAGINDQHNGNDFAFIQRGNHGHPRFKNGSNKIPAGSSGDLFMINGDNYDNDIHIFATGGTKYYTNTGGTGAEGGRVILSNIINHSDNRIKHNEVTISDALINIRKLEPKKYFKTNLPTLYPENHNFEMKNGKYVDNNGNHMSGIMECGLIAQEVEKIPFFESSVKKPKNEEDIYGLNYTNIFVTTLAALKELDILHTRTKQELANEKLKVSDLEKRLSDLEKNMSFNN